MRILSDTINMNIQKLGLRSFAMLLITTSIPVYSLSNPAHSSQDLVLCKLKNGVRTLHIQKNNDGQWNAIYTKGVVESIVGKGLHRNVCDTVVKNIRINLESAGWKCRDVKESRVSNLSSESP